MKTTSEQDFIDRDPYLKDYVDNIVSWRKFADQLELKVCTHQKIKDFASGHLYYGLHDEDGYWCIREWLPNAYDVFLIGEFTNWLPDHEYQFDRCEHGAWEISIPKSILPHKSQYALWVRWNGGEGKRIPAWAQRVVQDRKTNIFNAQVWQPMFAYEWKNRVITKHEAPLIYEGHIGMAGEEERVHTYNDFKTKMLPRIKELGYNTLQLMAIPEHPYYGSFGYHVSSFFAPSSRFGTPDELKALIDEAHGMGIRVIMDLVHSHAVKNEIEGLGRLDGTQYQFFHEGAKGEHPAWDSYCFNYGKPQVVHFLLSNIRYWMEEYRFDGFRFDGVTSMLYFDHGLGNAYTQYADYFTPNLDFESIAYLRMANKLIKQINPYSLSIAEEMSALPGLAAPLEEGGVGFDYRMSMGVPDFWIKTIKEKDDIHWNLGEIFHQLSTHRTEERVISYVESHDQALVGDKTVIFRLIDKEMYFSMRKDQPNLTVDRGIALHKLIRLLTASCAGGGYLNFMGNEFGHPEWIDFPREGNEWSYKHARRLWSIAENTELRFHWLSDFDKALINLLNEHNLLRDPNLEWITGNQNDNVLVYKRKDLLFVYNLHPENSYEHYGIELPPAKYKVVLNSDAHQFGGFNRIDDKVKYYTLPTGPLSEQHFLRLYLPARTALVLQEESYKHIL